MKNRRKGFFRKLTIIDYGFILLFILAVGFSLFYFLRKKAYVFVDLTFNRIVDWREFPLPPEYWEVSALSSGDVAYNSIGRKIAEVVEVNKSYWGADRMNVNVVVRVEGTYNTYTHQYVFDGKPLLVGNDLTLNIGSTKFTGVISNVYLNQEDRFAHNRKANIEVVLKSRELDPWHTEALRNFVAKNSSGTTIAQVKKAEIEPAEVLATTDDGRLLRGAHPFKKDVTITLNLFNVICSGQSCYYEDIKPLKIGEVLWVSSDKTSFGGSIMDMKISYIE